MVLMALSFHIGATLKAHSLEKDHEKAMKDLKAKYEEEFQVSGKEVAKDNERSRDAQVIISEARRQTCKPAAKVTRPVVSSTNPVRTDSDDLSLRIDPNYRSSGQWLRISNIAELAGDRELSLQAKSRAAENQ
jgi:hypothetical protein